MSTAAVVVSIALVAWIVAGLLTGVIQWLWGQIDYGRRWALSRVSCHLLGHKWEPGGVGREVCVRMLCRGSVERRVCSCIRPSPTLVYDANGYRRWCGRCQGELR